MPEARELRADLTRRSMLLQAGAMMLVPLVASAREGKRAYRIGVLTPSLRAEPNYDGLFDELRQLGFVAGQNPIVDGRGFAARFAQLPQLAAELVEADVDAILCGGDLAIRAAQQATRTIPIIGVTDDMVGAGLVRSLARPGSNTTGISMLASDLDGKRQEILIDLVPGARRIAALADPNTTPPERLRVLEDAARKRGVELSISRVARPEEVSPAVSEAKAAGAEALLVVASPLFNITRHLIIERTAALRLPAIYHTPEMAEEGGLIAYGPRFSRIGRMQAQLLVKVLRGAKPADVPVEQPVAFELVVNLKTAQAMGLEVPAEVLALADQAIEDDCSCRDP